MKNRDHPVNRNTWGDIVVLVIIFAAFVLLGVTTHKKACAMGYCPSTPCIDSSICFDGCSCLSSGGGLGRCVSIN